MEKADIKKKIHLALVALIISIQKGTGFSTFPSALTRCASSTANISYNFSIDANETIVGKRVWLFGAGKIAESNGTTLIPDPSYSSRLTAYGTYGISLSNITVADAGTYTYVIVLLPATKPYTATTALSVQVAPLAPPSGCQVSATQSFSKLKCAVNTDSGNCGTPSLNAFWVYSTNTSSQFECKDGGTYQCCATSAALTCYSGSSNDFCKLFTCTGTKCQLELGLALGLGLGIPCVITIIDVGIIIYTSCKYAYILGLVLDLGLGVTFQVGWIIIVSLISKGSECKLELGLGLGLSSGMLYVISGIVSVIFMFFVFFLCKGIPNRVELGKGILTGFLLASVIGIILVYLKYDKLKREPTCTKHEDNPPKPDDHKSKTKNSGHPTSHLGKNNKVDPNTNSKQANDRQQPVPPVNTAFEDTRTFHPLPQRPQNGEIKDQNLRGRSATIDDTPGLANETSRNNILPPLTLEPKKKRKKNKKKDQRNEKTPEDENSETIMIVD